MHCVAGMGVEPIVIDEAPSAVAGTSRFPRDLSAIHAATLDCFSTGRAARPEFIGTIRLIASSASLLSWPYNRQSTRSVYTCQGVLGPNVYTSSQDRMSAL